MERAYRVEGTELAGSGGGTRVSWGVGWTGDAFGVVVVAFTARFGGFSVGVGLTVFSSTACREHHRTLEGGIRGNVVLVLNGGRTPTGCPSGACGFHRSDSFLCFFNRSRPKCTNMVSVRTKRSCFFKGSMSVSSVV